MRKTTKKIRLQTDTLRNLAQHEIRDLANHELNVVAGAGSIPGTNLCSTGCSAHGGCSWRTCI
jgi:hypothetical protein